VGSNLYPALAEHAGRFSADMETGMSPKLD